jgi:UDP-3-O-[3-hydroxymyristoyl] N-acetylglucosamine deacetylase
LLKKLCDKQMPTAEKKLSVKYSGRGLTSKSVVNVEIVLQEAGHGIVFDLASPDGIIHVAATADNVVNTMRNVTLGQGRTRLCLVEHLLCAVSLWGLDDLTIAIDGPEVPLGDGSASMWIDLFEQAGWEAKKPEIKYYLKEPVCVQKGDRLLLALPDSTFSAHYMIDWNHPLIGKRWQSFDDKTALRDIASARTFGSLAEHKLLGIAGQVVSFTEDNFDMPLRFEDEPVRHKVLDLIGDLRLSGVNPLSLAARFISIKAGHELDVEMAKKLAAVIA